MGALRAYHTHKGAEVDKAAADKAVGDSSEDKRPDFHNSAEQNPRPDWG